MKLQRFDMQHLRDFRGPIAVNAAALADAVEATPPPPPPPIFSEADLDHARDAAKKLGYAEGFEAGLAQANTEATACERDLAHSLSRISDQLGQLATGYQQLITAQSAEMTELVLLIARKVAGEALNAHGSDTITGLVARCLPIVFSKPRVTLELAPQTLATIEPVLREQIARAGYAGDLIFRADESLEPHDIRIDWVLGQATRSTTTLWQEIEALLASVPLTPTLPRATQQTHEGDHHG